jgi:cytochrome c oxidase subunit 2
LARHRIRLRFVLLSLGLALLVIAVAAPTAMANTVTLPPSHSPNAKDMSDAYKVIGLLAVVLAVAINLALIVVVIRFRGERGREPARVRGTGRVQLRVGAVLAVIAAGTFVVGVVFNQRARDVAPTEASGLTDAHGNPQTLLVHVAGQQWIWRYTYPDGTFSYYQLVVPVNTTVNLNVDSTDVVHRWWVPALAGKADAVPGRINRIWFRADHEGIYNGQSAAFSGASYPVMRTQVKVVGVPAYRTWLAQQKHNLSSAQAIVQKRVSSQSPDLKSQVSG